MISRRITEVGKAIGRVLRHHWSLLVNLLGFAWLTDVQQRVWDDEKWLPTETEILMAVAKDDLVRFQAVGLDKGWILRATHGHSEAIGRQLRDSVAFGKIERHSGVYMAHNATRFALLPDIVGRE